MRELDCHPPTNADVGGATATALRVIDPGLLMKFEMDQAGGSHKARAARHVVCRAVADGHIVPGHTTVIEKTGGNFGVGLQLACAALGVRVELAVGLSFSTGKRRYLEWIGCQLVGLEEMRQGATPREVLERRLAQAPTESRSYYYPDQFNNPWCVEAHELDTGSELVRQLSALKNRVRAVRLVACAGTGAHITGIGRALRAAGYETDITLVEPVGCDSKSGRFIDHPLEGMAVGVKPPLLDWTLVNQTVSVTAEAAESARRALASERGYFVGRTTGACLAGARSLGPAPAKDAVTVVIAYDQGGWYA